jgi:uncharacterized membrane protein YeaQ/YmgE (transglycosylase-associated protein family)
MIITILLGLLIGAVAKLLMPGKDPGGWIITCFLGIVGSCIANLLGTRAGLYSATEPAGFIASVLGAVLLLFIYRVLVRKTA